MFSAVKDMEGRATSCCEAQKRVIRRRLLTWFTSTAVLLGLEQVLLKTMEESVPLKIRSDLYSYEKNNFHESSNMTELPENNTQLSTHDTNRNLVEKDQRYPEHTQNRPKDWNPNEACYVCTGNQNSQETTKDEALQDGNSRENADENNRESSPVISIGEISNPHSPHSIPNESRKTPERYESPVDVTSPKESTNCRDSPEASLDLSTNPRSLHTSPRSHSTSPVQFEPYRLFANKNTNTEDHDVQPFNTSLYPANLPPHLIPWLISSQIQNFVNYRNHLDGGASYKELPKSSILFDDKESQPLDLSAKKSPPPNLTDEELVNRVLEFKSSARGRKRADSNKKSYTEEELHAALKDILGGKLGTRKAAVHYGIPRSTLRNKVQKLTIERERSKKLIEQTEKTSIHSPDSTGHIANHSEFLASTQAETSSNVLKNILRTNMYEKLEELTRKNRTFLSGGETQKFLDTTMNYMLEKIPELALNTENRKTPSEVLSSLALYPKLQEFTHKIVEDRFNEEIAHIKSKFQPLPPLPHEYHASRISSPLNIPSYAPSLGVCLNNNNDLPEKKAFSSSQLFNMQQQANFKEVLSQLISHKIATEELANEQPMDVSSPPTLLPLPVQNMNIGYGNTLMKMPAEKQEPSKKRAKSPSSAGGKGSRPKRGKYRNYDRAKLLLAVQAVQCGEMSVHRAGTVYGVPHSTLEYKVKERHLNRGKKKDTVTSMNPPSPVHSNSASRTVLKDPTRPEIPDTTTLDYQSHDNSSTDDISVISVRSNPHKRPHPSDDHDSPPPVSTAATNPFLANPFSFWNTSAPMIPPFISRPYHPDSLYAPPFMQNFGDHSIFSGLNKLNSMMKRDQPTPEDSSSRTAFDLPSPPPLSQSGANSFQEDLINNILRRKMEANLSESSQPAQDNVQMRLQREPNDIKDRISTSPPIVPQSNMFVLNQLLPSFLAARTSIAAALCSTTDKAQTDNDDSQDSQAQPASLALVKESSA